MGPWAPADHLGFIPGRSMMANVVELEAHSLHTAAAHRQSMMMVVDFKTAFLPVSHEFMLKCLSGPGVPIIALQVLKALYLGSACKVAAGVAR